MNLHPNLRSLQIVCLAGILSTGIACNGPSANSKLPAADTLHTKEGDSIPPAGDTTKIAMATPALTFLSEMGGKYPAEVKLFDNPVLFSRLEFLIGKLNYRLLRENWNVESPIILKDGLFTAEACMQHNCDVTNFIIVADIPKNKLYAGIREEGKVKTFGEDSTTMPDISAWSNRKED